MSRTLEHKLFVKNIFALSVANALKMLFGALVMIVFARMLGAQDFGKISFAISFVSLFAILADFGINSYAVVGVSSGEHSASHLANSVFSLKLVLSICIFCAMYLVLHFLDYPWQVRCITYLFGLSVLIDSFADFICSLFRGVERMKYETWISFAQNAVLFIAVAVALKAGLSLVHVSVVWLISRLIGLLFSIRLFGALFSHIKFQIDFAVWKNILKSSYVFGLYLLFAGLYNKINIIFLSKTKGNAEVGFYQAAVNILILAVFLLDNFLAAILPFIARRFSENQGGFSVMVHSFNKVLFACIFPIVSFIYFFAEQIIFFCYGRQMSPAVILLRFLCVAYMLQYAPPSGIVFLAIKKERICLFVALCCAVFNVCANAIFIPLYGAKAAAFVFAGTFLLMRLSYAFAYKSFKLDFLDFSYFLILIVSLLLGFSLQLIGVHHILFNFFLYFVFYGIIFWFVIMKKEERRFYSGILRNLLLVERDSDNYEKQSMR